MAPKKKKDSWSFKPWKSSYVAQNNKDSHVAMIFFHDCKRCIRAPKKEMTIRLLSRPMSTYGIANSSQRLDGFEMV